MYLDSINIEAMSFAGHVPLRGNDFEKHHHTKHVEFTDSTHQSKVHFKAWHFPVPYLNPEATINPNPKFHHKYIPRTS